MNIRARNAAKNGSERLKNCAIGMLIEKSKCADKLSKCATSKYDKSYRSERPRFSPAVMKLSKANLKKYEEEDDEAFLQM